MSEEPKTSPAPSGCGGNLLFAVLIAVILIPVVIYYGWKLFVFAALAAMFSQG